MPVHAAEAGPVDGDARAVVEEAEGHAVPGELPVTKFFGEVEGWGQVVAPGFEFGIERADFGLHRGPCGRHDGRAVKVREDFVGEHAKVDVIEEVEGGTGLRLVEPLSAGLLRRGRM